MKIPIRLIGLLSLSALIFITCSVGEYQTKGYAASEPMMSVMEEADVMAGADWDESISEDSFTRSEKSSQSPKLDQSPSQPMRIYNGSAHLVVEDPQDTRNRIEARAKEWGGYLESAYGNTMVLRVPAELFYQSFDELLTYGQVVDERIETWDVSEQFQDLQGRLKLSSDTRERLYQLLNRTEDPQERSNILREIGRLTEEIEQIRLNMQSLENKASFSRITLVLEPRLQRESYSRNTIPFNWIANLNPLYGVGDKFSASLDIDLGSAFAVFKDSNYYLAENPQGVILRATTIENQPQGDSLFWQKALLFHLNDYYARADEVLLQIGDQELPAVNFISKDRDPYGYSIAVKSDGKKLHLIEIFYPDPDWDNSDLISSLKQGRLK